MFKVAVGDVVMVAVGMDNHGPFPIAEITKGSILILEGFNGGSGEAGAKLADLEGVPAKAVEALAAAEVLTVADYKALTDEERAAVKGVGGATYAKIDAAIEKLPAASEAEASEFATGIAHISTQNSDNKANPFWFLHNRREKLDPKQAADLSTVDTYRV